MDDLPPCPFCGHIGVTVGPGSTFRWRVAECDSCGAHTGEIRCQTSGEPREPEKWESQAKADAIKEWSRRAHSTNLPQSHVAVPELVITGISKEQSLSIIDAAWGSCYWSFNKCYPADGVTVEYKPAMLRAAAGKEGVRWN